jgi:hypothetical protein
MCVCVCVCVRVEGLVCKSVCMGVCYVIEIASKVEINKLKVWHARTQGERKTDQVFVCFLNGVGKQNKSSFS